MLILEGECAFEPKFDDSIHSQRGVTSADILHWSDSRSGRCEDLSGSIDHKYLEVANGLLAGFFKYIFIN